MGIADLFTSYPVDVRRILPIQPHDTHKIKLQVFTLPPKLTQHQRIGGDKPINPHNNTQHSGNIEPLEVPSQTLTLAEEDQHPT